MSELPLDDIDRETGWSRAVIRLMARAISHARSEKPTSWALLKQGNDAVLHVGKRNVCVLTPDMIELFVSVKAVEQMDLGHLEVTTKEMPNQWFPNGGKMAFPASAAVEIVEKVAENHLRAVRDVARIATAEDKRRLHDERLRIQLNEVGGVNITRPGYGGYKTLNQ